MFTYTPQWDAVRSFFDKVRAQVPEDYRGWAGIRLHRTGFPLLLVLFGSEVPEETLFPMVLLEFDDGQLKRNWTEIQDGFDVPWVKLSDFSAFCKDVMAYYHAEDLLEPTAIAILDSPTPDAKALKAAVTDVAGALAGP